MNMTYYDSLVGRAKRLGRGLNTKWAEKHKKQYDMFADSLEELYKRGRLTAREFNDLAIMAFYDYDNLKNEYL